MRLPATAPRAMARLRRAARSCAAGATYGAAVAWWCAYGVVYSGIGLVFTAAAMVCCSIAAGLCWVVSGE